MKRLALVLSLFVAIIGAIGVFRPEALVGVGLTPGGLYVAAVRIILGIALILGAASSRAPRVIRILGTLILVAGLATPFVGPERARRVVDWWSSQGLLVMRAWAGFALAFGSFLVWALVPKSSAA